MGKPISTRNERASITGLLFFITFFLSTCMTQTNSSSQKKLLQLTNSPKGHTLHHNGVFSKDGNWIVFDGRNEDTQIGSTSEIGLLDLSTKKEMVLYRTTHASIYGPGVGAASFSPVSNKVVFIHGLLNANKEKPYAITRRTGVAVDIETPQKSVFLDARDITPPYTVGSLRGGTHSHCWSPDGRLISFTYNDEWTEPDLRTVGVMFPVGDPVLVDKHEGNNNGDYYAVVIADVKADPKPGSDEISKAFDECWVGRVGQENVLYLLAFQGNTLNKQGEIVTEIFVVELHLETLLADTKAVGVAGTRPRPPLGVQPRRISRTAKGLSPVRHWLRSDREGKYIYALAEDSQGIAQLIQCEIQTGKIRFLTKNSFPIDYSFNLSADGKRIAFIGNNNVYLYEFDTGNVVQLTSNTVTDLKITGAPSFSPDDKTIVFNQYVIGADHESYLQIMAINVPNP